nr:MAG TPA: hypothetical protein [Crassvirales sp.]
MLFNIHYTLTYSIVSWYVSTYSLTILIRNIEISWTI